MKGKWEGLWPRQHLFPSVSFSNPIVCHLCFGSIFLPFSGDWFSLLSLKSILLKKTAPNLVTHFKLLPYTIVSVLLSLNHGEKICLVPG